MPIGRSQVSLGRIPSTKFALGHLVKAPVRDRSPLYRATSFLSFIQTDAFINLPANRKQPSVFYQRVLFFSFFFLAGSSFLANHWQGSHICRTNKRCPSLLCPPCLSSLPLFSYSSSGSLKKRTCHLAYRAKKKERELISCRLIADTSTHCPTYLPRSLPPSPSRCVLFMLY